MKQSKGKNKSSDKLQTFRNIFETWEFVFARCVYPRALHYRGRSTLDYLFLKDKSTSQQNHPQNAMNAKKTSDNMWF